MSVDWDAIGYLISSQYRLAVVRRLANAPATPTEIATAESLAPSHVSRALRQLGEFDLVSVTVPDTRTERRRYELTSCGESTWEVVRVNNLSD